MKISKKRLSIKVISMLLMMAVFILPLLTGCDSSEESSEIILQNFSADETYFVAGYESNITFTVDVEGTVSSVDLCSDYGTVVGEMHDDGMDGDIAANDGTYTYVYSFTSENANSINYFAKSQGVISDNITIYIFDTPTEETKEEVLTVEQKVSDIETEFLNSEGYVLSDKVSDVLYQVEDYVKELYENGDVISYEVTESSVVYKLSNGMTMVYAPNVKGTYSIDKDISMTVSVYQPYYDWESTLIDDYINLPTCVNKEVDLLSAAATDVSNAFDNYSYSSSTIFKNKKVSLDSVKSFGENQIILWQGHGVYGGSKIHSLILTGSDFNWDEWLWNPIYYLDVCQDRIVNSYESETFSSKYIDKYVKNLNNSFIYLGPCESGYDNVLAKSFLNKGASAVIANTKTILCLYGDLMEYKTVHMLSQINPETNNYYTLSEALSYAKEVYGEDDSCYGGVGSTPKIFGGDNAENYRLAEYVPVSVSEFTVPDSKVLTIGQIDIIEPEIAPEDATDYTIEWTSSDESVVTVNPTGEYGTLTGKSKGTATITAELTSGNNVITKSTQVSVASKGRDTVLVLDVSGSMSGTPLTEMKESALQFCDDLLLDEYNNRVAIVCFDDSVTYHSFSNDLSELKEYINNISDGGSTNMTAALEKAEDILDNEGVDDHIKNIVIMADGLPNRGQTSDSGSAEFNSSSYIFFSSGEEYANAVVDTANEIMQKYNMYSLGFFHSLSGSDYDNCSKLMSKLTNMENGYHEVDQAENLQFEFGDIADDITDGSKIVINIACPVDVSVSYDGETLSSASDSYNDSVSFGTLQLLGSKQDVKVLSLDSDKVYDVELSGTDTGTMDYSVNYINENDEITDYRNFSSVPITDTTVIDSSTDNSTTVNLNIDNDGDGVVDIIWGADSNSNAEIIEDNTPTEPETTEPQTTVMETEPSIEPEKNNEDNDNVFMILIILFCSLIALGVIILLIIVGVRHKKAVRLTDEQSMLTDDAVTSVEKINNKEDDVKCDATLEILSGSMEGMKIPVISGEILALGKNPSLCQVVFTPDYSRVSRLHCTIMFDKNIEKFFVTDSSSNGTYFAKNRKLEKGKRTAVQNGTILYLSDENCSIRLLANSN